MDRESRNCMICGKPTHGSVGAAGIIWPSICQECKDYEDRALLNSIKYQALVFEKILEGVRT